MQTAQVEVGFFGYVSSDRVNDRLRAAVEERGYKVVLEIGPGKTQELKDSIPEHSGIILVVRPDHNRQLLGVNVPLNVQVVDPVSFLDPAFQPLL